MEFSRQEYWSGLPFPSPKKSSNLIYIPERELKITFRKVLTEVRHTMHEQKGTINKEIINKRTIGIDTCTLKVTQLCLTFCNSMDYIVHGILQARILEWLACSFSRGSSQSRDLIQVSHIAGGFLTN